MAKKSPRQAFISTAITEDEFERLVKFSLGDDVSISSILYVAIQDITDGFRDFSRIDKSRLTRRRHLRFPVHGEQDHAMEAYDVGT